MKKGGITEERIAFALKQAETGTPVAEVLRRMGISEQTFYRRKKLYGGLGTSELRRLKPFEALCSSESQSSFGIVSSKTKRPPEITNWETTNGLVRLKP